MDETTPARVGRNEGPITHPLRTGEIKGGGSGWRNGHADRIADVRIGSLIAMNLIFFVPVSIMAMVSPYIIGITAAGRRPSWLTAGMVLFISTVGSFFGTNVTAFFLIGLFPVSRIITGLGLIGLAVSLCTLALRPDRRMAK